MIKHKNNKLDNINFKNRKHYVQQHENRNTVFITIEQPKLIRNIRV